MSNRRIFIVLIVLVTLLATVSVAAAQEVTYVVQRGDRLSKIAEQYNVNVYELARYNNIANINRIYAGQIIRIPGPGSPPPQQPGGTYATYIVDRGDTLQKIAVRCGTTWQFLAQLNNIANPNRIAAGMRIIVPNNGCSNDDGSGGGATPVVTNKIHYVRPGQYLTQIARHYGVTVQSIIALNNLTTTVIYPGQRLLIPHAAGPVQPPPQPQPRHVVNGYYRVQYGDTMLKISGWFGVDAWTVARANGIYNLNHIYAGQYLRIPGY